MQKFLLKNRLILGILFLMGAIYVGVDMFLRYREQLLWGYRPLFLFTTFVLAWVFIFGKKRFRQGYRYQHFMLALLSAVLLSLGFPALPLPFFMFLGFIPLLIIEENLANQPGKTGWQWILTCYFAFILWNIWTTYWVANTAFFAGVFAIAVNSLLMCLPMALFRLSRKYMSPTYGYASLVAYWVTFEWAHMQWELSWPWLTLGNSLASLPPLAQWYSFTGTFGGTFWILLLNILGFIWYRSRQAGETNSGKHGLTYLFWLIVPILLSLFMYFRYEENGVSRNVMVVQPNFEPHYEKFNLPRDVQFQRFIDLTKQGLDEETDYLVYPETSFGLIDHHKLFKDRRINELQQLLDSYPGLKLVTGIAGYEILPEYDENNPNIRIQERGNADTLYWVSYNSVIQLKSGSRDVPVYYKSKLVPGAEIFPYNQFFFFMKFLVDKLGGTTAGLGTQEDRSVFSSKDGKVAPVICYESVYGEYCVDYVRKGAEAIFIITNDGWWDYTAGHRQHLQFASLRAIETRRSIARSANTGISAFIDQRGNIHQPTEYGETGWIKGDILFNQEITFYARWGDIIARVSLFATAIFFLNTLVNGIRQHTDVIDKERETKA